MKRIVVIGGGTGTFTVLQGLRDFPFELSAIVSTADDGGSTGILRDELGVLPPGDIRQALVALSTDSTVLRDLLSYRFSEGGLSGHNFGNLLLSALEKVTGSFDRAVLEAGRILSIRGHVIPMASAPVALRAETADGQVIRGEQAIDEHIWSEASPVERLWLEPACDLHPLAEVAICQADLIIIAPGSLYTSLIPTLLTGGMREALAATRAELVYVANLMTEKGQAGSYSVQDCADLLEEYVGSGRLDYVVYNTRQPDAALLDRYKKEMERSPVRLDPKRRRGLSYRLVGTNLLSRRPASGGSGADRLKATRTLIRHDPRKLADVLYALASLREAKKYLK